MQCSASAGGKGSFGKETKQAYQKPVAVNAGVPVKTAIESRRERARRERIGIAGKDVRDLIRVLAMHASQREVGETLDILLGKLRTGLHPKSLHRSFDQQRHSACM